MSVLMCNCAGKCFLPKFCRIEILSCSNQEYCRVMCCLHYSPQTMRHLSMFCHYLFHYLVCDVISLSMDVCVEYWSLTIDHGIQFLWISVTIPFFYINSSFFFRSAHPFLMARAMAPCMILPMLRDWLGQMLTQRMQEMQRSLFTLRRSVTEIAPTGHSAAHFPHSFCLRS